MLRAENVTVRFGNRTAVESASFSVAPGQWWMLVGPNGAGKTTLVNALARAVPYSGGIYWEEREIKSFKSSDYAKKVGILSQINGIEYGFSVEEVAALGRYAHQSGFLRRGDAEGEQRVRAALEMTGLWQMRGRCLGTLSGGETQRVFLAQVFSQDPQLLILDEPANHLDLPYQQQMFSLIGKWLAQPGRAVIAVVHDLALARRYGTHALLLKEGKTVAAGDARRVLTREHLLSAYGMDVHAWMREMLSLWAD